MSEALIGISEKGFGCAGIVKNDALIGIVTDGDLRRMLENEKDISSLCAKDIMSCDPKITKPEDLAYNALKEMEQNNITQLIVIKSEKYLGVIHIHDIIKEGIISQ